MNSIADMPVPAFNALAALNIYHFADLAWPSAKTAAQRRKLLKTLHDHGILTHVQDPENGSAIQARYNQAIEDHAGNTLPDGWDSTFDYWGARCYCLNPGWNAPKTGTVFAGDSSSRYETFADAEALQATTNAFLAELQREAQLEAA